AAWGALACGCRRGRGRPGAVAAGPADRAAVGGPAGAAVDPRGGGAARAGPRRGAGPAAGGVPRAGRGRGPAVRRAALPVPRPATDHGRVPPFGTGFASPHRRAPAPPAPVPRT